MTQQWTKAELEDWCRSWCRTPHTTLKAFIDAGFCSDQEPSREEMRLLRQDTPSTASTTNQKARTVYPFLSWLRFEAKLREALLEYDEPMSCLSSAERGESLADAVRAALTAIEGEG